MSKTLTIEPLLVSAADAARLLGISRSKFYQMLSSGEIPLNPVSFGKRKLWSVERLRFWVQVISKEQR